MFRFEQPEQLYYIFLIPLVAILFIVMRRKQVRAMSSSLGEAKLLARLAPEASSEKRAIKLALLILSFVFFLIAYANPQWGFGQEKAKRKATDVIVALDVSSSMLAQDIAPNRLERAKGFALKLINALKGERVGVIVFAGNAFLQMPLTTDYAAVQMLIKTSNPDMVSAQGTAIGAAIDIAVQTFPKNDKYNKALIFLSDGETHDDDALEKAREARKQGILLFGLGVGTSRGAFIPVVVDGFSEYKRDEQGQPIRSKLSEAALRKLTETGGGSYLTLNEDEAALAVLRGEVSKMEKRELEQTSFSRVESYFQYFLFIGILLVAIEFFMFDRKRKKEGSFSKNAFPS